MINTRNNKPIIKGKSVNNIVNKTSFNANTSMKIKNKDTNFKIIDGFINCLSPNFPFSNLLANSLVDLISG